MIKNLTLPTPFQQSSPVNENEDHIFSYSDDDEEQHIHENYNIEKTISSSFSTTDEELKNVLACCPMCVFQEKHKHLFPNSSIRNPDYSAAAEDEEEEQDLCCSSRFRSQIKDISLGLFVGMVCIFSSLLNVELNNYILTTLKYPDPFALMFVYSGFSLISFFIPYVIYVYNGDDIMEAHIRLSKIGVIVGIAYTVEFMANNWGAKYTTPGVNLGIGSLEIFFVYFLVVFLKLEQWDNIKFSLICFAFLGLVFLGWDIVVLKHHYSEFQPTNTLAGVIVIFMANVVLDSGLSVAMQIYFQQLFDIKMVFADSLMISNFVVLFSFLGSASYVAISDEFPPVSNEVMFYSFLLALASIISTFGYTYAIFRYSAVWINLWTVLVTPLTFIVDFYIRHINVTMTQIVGTTFICISIILYVFYSQSLEMEIDIGESIQKCISNSTPQSFLSDLDFEKKEKKNEKIDLGDEKNNEAEDVSTVNVLKEKQHKKMWIEDYTNF